MIIGVCSCGHKSNRFL